MSLISSKQLLYSFYSISHTPVRLLLHFQVCHEQNIRCETEYFGLVVSPRATTRSERLTSDHTPSIDPADTSLPSVCPSTLSESLNYHSITEQETPRVRQWLNLRNPLGRCDGGFLSLALRVKFWVPVHLILQESVRNLFYMEARQELLDNRMFATDWANAIKLAALMAHADGIRFNPECLEESTRSKVANRPTTTLSNQNSLEVQQLGQQQRRRGSKRKSSEPSVDIAATTETTMKECFNPLSVYEPYLSVRPRNKSVVMSKEKLLCAIAEEHHKYKDDSPKSAKYWLLAEFGSLPGFGEEKFIVPKVGVDGVTSQMEVTVGPEGLGLLHPKGDERQE